MSSLVKWCPSCWVPLSDNSLGTYCRTCGVMQGGILTEDIVEFQQEQRDAAKRARSKVRIQCASHRKRKRKRKLASKKSAGLPIIKSKSVSSTTFVTTELPTYKGSYDYFRNDQESFRTRGGKWKETKEAQEVKALLRAMFLVLYPEERSPIPSTLDPRFRFIRVAQTLN